MKLEIILFLTILQLTTADDLNLKSKKSLKSNKKSVRFNERREMPSFTDSSSGDFNFGEPQKKRKSNSNSGANFSRTSKIQQNTQPKLKSALKVSTQPNNGVFDISSYGRSTDGGKQKAAFAGSASSINNLEKRHLFSESDQGPIVPGNPFRNVGPTPEFLTDIGPERFWLPPNAPITERFPGPWLQYDQGVPGSGPGVSNRIRVEDAFLPQVQGLTGPRDVEIPTDPFPAIRFQDGLAAVQTGTEISFRPPCELTPLNPVTPLPGGNIIDPLSPQVTNVRGPFFPDTPRADGVFIFDTEQPQLVAQDIEDGPYIVERVMDPIVFFDPIQQQTVLFDPLRNFTRLFNPETDPQLLTDEALLNIGETAGGLLKSTNPQNGKIPSFWILKKLDPNSSQGAYKNLEKAAINGQAQNLNKNGAAGGGRIIFQSNKNIKTPESSLSTPPPINKNQHISYKKKSANPSQSQQSSKSKQKDSEPLRIQLAPVNPKPVDKKVEPLDDKKQIKNQNRHNVKLVYSPIVDLGIDNRYGGFKANGNKNSSTSTRPSSKTILLSFLIIFAAIIL